MSGEEPPAPPRLRVMDRQPPFPASYSERLRVIADLQQGGLPPPSTRPGRGDLGMDTDLSGAELHQLAAVVDLARNLLDCAEPVVKLRRPAAALRTALAELDLFRQRA